MTGSDICNLRAVSVWMGRWVLLGDMCPQIVNTYVWSSKKEEAVPVAAADLTKEIRYGPVVEAVLAGLVKTAFCGDTPLCFFSLLPLLLLYLLLAKSNSKQRMSRFLYKFI